MVDRVTMNRAEKRRQQKLSGKATVPQQGAAIQQAMQQAMGQAAHFHALGDLPKAKNIAQQILQVDAEHPDALHLLGTIACQIGKNDIAVELITKALAIRPDLGAAHINLGNALQNLGRLDEALEHCHKAIALLPGNPEPHYHLGNILHKLARRDEAVVQYCEAIEIKPDYALAHNNLGSLKLELGILDEAVECFQKVIQIAPDFAYAYNNLATTLQNLDQAEAAFGILQTAVTKFPADRLVADSLIDLLNFYMPDSEARDVYTKAQRAMQLVSPEQAESPGISDQIVKRLYLQCRDVLADHSLTIESNFSQIFRGKNIDLGCDRHFKVFDTFNAIPKNCFGCYKVLVEPRTVIELMKLLLVFDDLELPGDNTRKCMVEQRPGISGTYKGYLYCDSFAEGQTVLQTIQEIIAVRISKDVPVSLRRGCSEFSVAYPEFGRMSANNPPSMTYNKDWSEHEDYVDTHLANYASPFTFSTHNHSGMSLRDAVIMENWLRYAATIGDENYLKISPIPLEKLPIEKREPFQSVSIL